jgi:Kef-type K+ transport system membrane component KefB
MGNFRLLAHPWWVNLLLLVPLVAYFLFRHEKPQLKRHQLLTSAIFALSFGFVEGAVAIYLGAAVGLLPGYAGTLPDVARLSADLHGQEIRHLNNMAPSLLTVEVFREAATMLMLLSVAILAEQKRGERLAIFLWIFALWDIGYYVALRAAVRWPYSPTSPDVLFFIPVPWTSQVWFPILISILTAAAILLTRHRGGTT